MADILTDEQVREIETEYEYGWLQSIEATISRHKKFADKVPDLIATLRHVQAENEWLQNELKECRSNKSSLSYNYSGLQEENARLREELKNIRDGRQWNAVELREIARQALATEGEGKG